MRYSLIGSADTSNSSFKNIAQVGIPVHGSSLGWDFMKLSPENQSAPERERKDCDWVISHQLSKEKSPERATERLSSGHEPVNPSRSDLPEIIFNAMIFRAQLERSASIRRCSRSFKAHRNHADDESTLSSMVSGCLGLELQVDGGEVRVLGSRPSRHLDQVNV